MAEPTSNAGPTAEGPPPSGNSPSPEAKPPGSPSRPILQEFPETSPDRPEDPASYKPLSLLALAGLIVSGSYGLFLLIYLVFSLLSRTPMLMSGLTLLWPLAGLGASVLGWFQIRRSEGTRAGTSLAYWGTILSVLFGLTYTAYLVANSLGINQQADPKIAEWFQLIKNNQLDEAFLLTLPVEMRPSQESPEALHTALENRFGGGDGGRRGLFADFPSAELIKRLTQAGAEANITSLGVKEWKYEKGGYLVRHTYQILTPEAEFEVLVTASAPDPKVGQGRTWIITLSETFVVKESVKLTPFGKKVSALETSAGMFADHWARALSEGRLGDAYRMTRDPAEQATLNPLPANLATLPGFKEFRDGDLVKADRFWAAGSMKTDIPPLIRKLFGQPGLFNVTGLTKSPGPDTLGASLQMKPPPYRWSRDGDQVRVACDVDVSYLTFQPNTGRVQPKYAIEGSILVEGPASLLDTAPDDKTPWRIVGLELRRGQAPSSGPGGLSAPRP